MHFRTKILGALVFSAFAFTLPIRATEVLTTSFTGWTATTTGSSTEWNFAFNSGGSYNTSSGYSLSVGSYGPITVTGPDGAGYSLAENSSYQDGSYTLQTLQGASDGVGSMLFTTPSSGVTAFLLGIGITGNAAPVTITLSDGESFTVDPAVNGNTIVGFSSATAITSFTLATSAGTAVELTDFFAANSNEPANTPSAPAAEVTTALMIGSGLLLFGARRRVFSNLSNAQS
jgi:hypothetical protein